MIKQQEIAYQDSLQADKEKVRFSYIDFYSHYDKGGRGLSSLT